MAYNNTSTDYVKSQLPSGDDKLVVSNKDSRVNESTVKSSIKDGILTVSYTGSAQTTAKNDGAVRDAYTYTWTKSYDINSGVKNDTTGVAKITNVKATLTEASIQLVGLSDTKFNPTNMNLAKTIIDFKNGATLPNSWTVISGELAGTIISLSDNNSWGIKMLPSSEITPAFPPCCLTLSTCISSWENNL